MNFACVKCTSVLDRSLIGDVEVDLCPSCGGLWLDRGEIDQLAAQPEEAIEALKAALTEGKPVAQSASVWRCPACPGRLREAMLGPVRVDYCLLCRGIFLDRGELDAVLAAVKGSTVRQLLQLAASMAGPPAP
jgi:Zn-finger nucleic acid-binding protein